MENQPLRRGAGFRKLTLPKVERHYYLRSLNLRENFIVHLNQKILLGKGGIELPVLSGRQGVVVIIPKDEFFTVQTSIREVDVRLSGKLLLQGVPSIWEAGEPLEIGGTRLELIFLGKNEFEKMGRNLKELNLRSRHFRSKIHEQENKKTTEKVEKKIRKSSPLRYLETNVVQRKKKTAKEPSFYREINQKFLHFFQNLSLSERLSSFFEKREEETVTFSPASSLERGGAFFVDFFLGASFALILTSFPQFQNIFSALSDWQLSLRKISTSNMLFNVFLEFVSYSSQFGFVIICIWLLRFLGVIILGQTIGQTCYGIEAREDRSVFRILKNFLRESLGLMLLPLFFIDNLFTPSLKEKLSGTRLMSVQKSFLSRIFLLLGSALIFIGIWLFPLYNDYSSYKVLKPRTVKVEKNQKEGQKKFISYNGGVQFRVSPIDVQNILPGFEFEKIGKRNQIIPYVGFWEQNGILKFKKKENLFFRNLENKTYEKYTGKKRKNLLKRQLKKILDLKPESFFTAISSYLFGLKDVLAERKQLEASFLPHKIKSAYFFKTESEEFIGFYFKNWFSKEREIHLYPLSEFSHHTLVFSMKGKKSDLLKRVKSYIGQATFDFSIRKPRIPSVPMNKRHHEVLNPLNIYDYFLDKELSFQESFDLDLFSFELLFHTGKDMLKNKVKRKRYNQFTYLLREYEKTKSQVLRFSPKRERFYINLKSLVVAMIDRDYDYFNLEQETL